MFEQRVENGLSKVEAEPKGGREGGKVSSGLKESTRERRSKLAKEERVGREEE